MTAYRWNDPARTLPRRRLADRIRTEIGPEADSWDLPEPPPDYQWTGNPEILAAVASLRFHDTNEPVPVPGKVTAEQAAEMFGVTKRTIWRYRRRLAAMAS